MDINPSDLSAVCLFATCSLAVRLVLVIRGRSDDEEIDQQQESTQFVKAGEHFLKWIVNYRENSVNNLPVISKVSPNFLSQQLPAVAPIRSEPWSAIFDDIDQKIVPGLTNWESSSKFFAYFKPHSSYPAVLGELLCAGLNVMGFDWIASPSCTELEVVVLDWLASFLNLPDRYHNLKPGPGAVK